MFRKPMLGALSCFALVTVANAQDSCPLKVDRNDVEAKPVTWRSFGDAYEIANAHTLIGSADTAPPSPIVDPACGPAGTTIGRAIYLGSLEGSAGFDLDGDGAVDVYGVGDRNDFVGVFVFNSHDVVAAANKHALRFRSIQNFVGNAYILTAKILENKGAVQGEPGARGLFNRPPVAAPSNNETANGGLGPFGAPSAGVLNTVIADARADRGSTIDGACTIPANGDLAIHDSGSGVTYATFDRSADVYLTDASSSAHTLRDEIRDAQNSQISYPTCRFSCTTPSPLIRNVACDVMVTDPLYVGVTAVIGGSATAMERLQDTLTVDDVLHVMGDTDYCGEEFPGQICGVTLVSKL